MEHNSPLLKCRLRIVTSFQSVQYGGGMDNFTVEEPVKHYLSQVTKVTINSDKSYSQYVPFIWCHENATLCGLLPKNI